MNGDQFGEFVCGYWGFEGLTPSLLVDASSTLVNN